MSLTVREFSDCGERDVTMEKWSESCKVADLNMDEGIHEPRNGGDLKTEAPLEHPGRNLAFLTP